IPAYFGTQKALNISRIFHIVSATLMVIFLYESHQLLNSIFLFTMIGTLIFIGLLFSQHKLVRPNDLSKVNLAFFTNNGIASLLYGVLFLIDIWL
ncbi:MAG TPA: 4-hydroxybenzoate octaprenyltransferase, partial [Saprospiraceae bacterium]|nr:4-hydroxybenzoate octaprenyltransferase [Saprospiraceae bacterium]